MSSLGTRVADSGIKVMIAIVDVKNDGVIDTEEFMALADMDSIRARKKCPGPIQARQLTFRRPGHPPSLLLKTTKAAAMYTSERDHPKTEEMRESASKIET